jgi:hypothetical protein
MHRANGGIGKGPGIKSRRFLGVAIVPKANRVFCWHWHHFSVETAFESNRTRSQKRTCGYPDSSSTSNDDMSSLLAYHDYDENNPYKGSRASENFRDDAG